MRGADFRYVPPLKIHHHGMLSEQETILPLPLLLHILWAVQRHCQQLDYKTSDARMNWRGFVRKRSLSNRATMPEFAWRP
jgi:hypothetical protein